LDVGPPKRQSGRPRGRPPKRRQNPGALREQVKANGARVPSTEAEALPPDIRVDKIVKFIEKECRAPEGKLMGQQIKLGTWELEAIDAIYGNPLGTRRAIISVARKNGKTSFAACLLLVHLIGPEAKGHENSQLFSAAQSRDQAALIFNAASKIIAFNADMRATIKITESSKTLTNVELNIRYRALAADATTAFGLSPIFIVHDEFGQICPRKQIKPLQNMGFQTAT
jgi:phage terminase large subunit-like protein